MEAIEELITRDAIPANDTWDLDTLYAAGETWQADFQSLESQIQQYASFQGTLGESADKLKACLEFDMAFSRTLEKIHTFAHLRNDEDKTNNLHQGNYEKVTRLLTQYQQARSFINSEIMEIPEATMQGFLDHPDLELYRLYLERQLRYRKHTLSKKEEALLAASLEIARAPQNAFGMLDNADLKLGTVKDEEGREIAITHGNLQSLLQKQDRRVRKESFETFYKAYEDHKFTYSTLLSSSLKKDIFYAQARNYSSVREMNLFYENIPVKVYDNLIQTVRNHIGSLYQYFDIRKRILGLDTLHAYDNNVPLVKDLQWNMPYDEGVDKICEALVPMGSEYVDTMRKGLLDSRWVDRYENKGKRSGAYSSGCYDSNPFILMNYLDDNINSVYTLAHEAGHSMHSYFSNRNQPYIYADYTIFVAEVASTFNEALLTRYFLSQDINRDMRIYLICREIDNIRGTLIRQTMFAEFEHEIYKAAEAGQPMTVEAFQEIYKSLLETYFGEGVVLDPCLSLECFRIPHFYFGFYVYKYATGISAAYALANKVLNGGEKELSAYLNFLKSGGSKFPIDLLKGAGVDMSSPEPIETALGKFGELVGELQALTT
jgi:oligoendopeptidase F